MVIDCTMTDIHWSKKTRDSIPFIHSLCLAHTASIRCAAQPDSLFLHSSKTNCTLLDITGRPIVQTNYKLRFPLRNKRSLLSDLRLLCRFLSKNRVQELQERNESEKLHGQSSTCFFDTFGTLRQSSFTGCQLSGKNPVRRFFVK